ncbi:MAG: CDP-alcohol phosphatidyltransferase family protein [Acidobacteriota bacterium]
MTLLRRYKESLKAIEAEEVFDLVIYRPLAFLFVTATYATNLTPNQVSLMAMAVGVTGGVLFGMGTPAALASGACCYFLSNVLDCADGQIARLKKNGTRIGRIVDGFIDYVVSIAVFLGIALALSSDSARGIMPPFGQSSLGITTASSGIWYAWTLTVLAGASTAYQAFHFDLARNNYLKYVYGKGSSLETEICEFEEERTLTLKGKKGLGRWIDLLLIAIYLRYTRLQLKSASSESAVNHARVTPEDYARHNKMLLRAWSFTGSTTHITLCVACALAGNLELFLLLTVLLNVLTLALQVLQSRAEKRTFAA